MLCNYMILIVCVVYLFYVSFCFFKQKTAYVMRISDWSSDVCSSDLLAGLKGAPLVVYFYPKADTPGCTVEAQDFTRLAPEFAHLGAHVIAVSRDAPAKLCKFRDKYGLIVRLASDEDGSVCEAFGTWVEKQNYGRPYMGNER